MLLKGPAQDLIEQGIFWSLPERATFELEPMIAFYRDAEISTEDDAYIHAKETDLKPSGPRIGFTFGMRKMIVCLAEGTVFELDYDRLEEATMKNFELLGFKGLIRALRRKGVSLFDEGALAELLESEKSETGKIP